MVWVTPALTAFSDASLSAYDRLALHRVGQPMDFRKTLFASFTGQVFSDNIGMSTPADPPCRELLPTWPHLSAVD